MNKANKFRVNERQLKSIIEESVNQIVAKNNKSYNINEGYNEFNSLQKLAYENQEMKSKIKEVAQFAKLVAGIAKSEGRDNYANFYSSLYPNITQMLSLWNYEFDYDE